VSGGGESHRFADDLKAEANAQVNPSVSPTGKAQSHNKDAEDELGPITCSTFSMADDSDDSMDTPAVEPVPRSGSATPSAGYRGPS